MLSFSLVQSDVWIRRNLSSFHYAIHHTNGRNQLFGRCKHIHVPYVRRPSFVHNCGHSTHGIALVCRRNMIATHLHSHHKFIGLTGHHSTLSGHRLGKGQCGSAVQNTKRLTIAMVDRHRGFHSFFRSKSVLNT